MAKTRKLKPKYYVVNSNCGDWFSNINQAIKEVKAGYFGEEFTILYSVKDLNDPIIDVCQLGFDDEIIEFENCKIIKDYRKKGGH